MRQVKLSKIFERNFRERIAHSAHLVEAYETSVELLFQNPMLVNSHPLTGSMAGLYSFSINDDYRVIYVVHKNTILIVDIGTHAQVYN